MWMQLLVQAPKTHIPDHHHRWNKHKGIPQRDKSVLNFGKVKQKAFSRTSSISHRSRPNVRFSFLSLTPLPPLSLSLFEIEGEVI